MRFLFFVLAVTCVHAASIGGKVVGIADGDTITVLTAAKETVKVRLHGIDAPESGQPFGARAKQELSSLVYGKTVAVEIVDKDRYGRTVGRVKVGALLVNVEMVRRGFAWWFRDYAKNDADLEAAEASARGARRGLWADKAPVAPWEWRRDQKQAAAAR